MVPICLLLAAANGLAAAAPKDAALRAPAPSPLEAGLPFLRSYGPREYGASAQNWAIVQDGRGVIYVGNSDGVLEFDGLRWRLIPTARKTAVRSLAVDVRGRVYVGAKGEIGYLEPDAAAQMRYVSLLDSVPPDTRDFADVWQTFSTPDGIYFHTFKRLFRLRGDQVKVWRPETAFHLSFLVGDRLFVLERERGLKELVEDRLRLVPGGERFAQERIYTMLPAAGADPAGKPTAILVGTRGRALFLLDEAEARPFPTEADDGLKADLHGSGMRLGDGRLALGTAEGGLYLLDPRGRLLGRLNKASGLEDETVHAVFQDREGGLWLALDHGLARVQAASPLTSFGESTGLRGGVVPVNRHRGQLHAGTSKGLFRLVGGPEPRFERVPGVKDQTWSLASVGESLLAGNNEGVYEVRGDVVELILKSTTAFALLVSKATPGRVFVGLKDGLASLRLAQAPAGRSESPGDRWRFEGRVPGVSDEIRTLFETPDGRLWACTRSNGVLRVTFPADGMEEAARAPRVERFGTTEGLPGPSEQGVYGVSGQALFATTRGVFRFDERRARFEADPRFASLFKAGPRWVHALEGGAQGRVFMHSKDEAHRVEEAGAAVPGPDGAFLWDPRPLRAFSGAWINTIRLDDDGVLWFGGVEGLFRYDARVAKDHDQPFTALVRRVSSPSGTVLFGGAGGVTSRALDYEDGSLRFDFAAPSFDLPGQSRFQVFLEGNDQGWSPWTAEGAREYTNLREGAYRFRVRARNGYGTVSEEGTYTFRVLPPWYRTWWAYVGCLVGACGLVWSLIRWRLRTLERQKASLEAVVAERTSELREAQEKLAHLLGSAPAALSDIRLWAGTAGEEIARAVGADEIQIWEVDKGALAPLSGPSVRAPSIEDLRSASSSEHSLLQREDEALVPVSGLSGELYGALVVRGAGVAWGDTTRRLVSGLAHQLGGALEVHRLRRQLEAAQERRAASRQELHDRGVPTLQTCPGCGRCYDHTAARCESDGLGLESPRLLPYRLLDRYRFTRLLGEGGMGTVYAAHDERLTRNVAIKLIRSDHFSDPEMRLRFEREARTIALIQHPGVVSLHDSGELPDGSAFLVMEKLVGCDLSVLLKAHGPGTPRQVADLVRQGAPALGAAHRAGVVHRDIKPENVFLVDDPGGSRVKILDFGLARPMSLEKGMTRTGMLVGTPQYMAPEQVQGEPVDSRADVYAFAAVCYEALTGRKAVDGWDLGRVMIAVLNSVPPPVSSLVAGTPAEVDAAFDSALAKDRGRRLKDVELWASSFVSALEGMAAVPGRPGWPTERGALGRLGDRLDPAGGA